MGAAVAAVLIKERHIVEAFARAGATTPDRAMALADVPVDPGGAAMRRLQARAVIREAAPGRFYADLGVWQAVRSTRRRLAVVLLVLVLLGMAGGLGGWFSGAAR